MSAEIQSLIELQQVDRQLLDLEKAKGNLPQRVEELKRRLSELVSRHEENLVRIETVERERRSAEGALTLAREHKKKYESQLYSVKTNREYDAITLEIENCEKEIDANETKILEALENAEKLREDRAQLEATIQEAQSEVKEQEALLNGMLQETQEHVDQLRRERQNLITGVRPNLLRLYDRIFQNRNGQAIVSVLRGACEGCGTRIPPQRAMEIREMKDIYHCENCGRILVAELEEPVEV